MKTDSRPSGALRLTPCSYGLSKLSFRGPRRAIDGRYIAFLGGSETFGKYIPKPFPELIETAIGEVCVNLGCQSASSDVFLNDTAIQSICHDAAASVIQISSAANLSNRYYKVHPRRNDRFIAPTEKLVALFPEVDFAEIAFTGHLISQLRTVDEDRFGIVRDHLQQTWVRRIKALVGQMSGPVLLLWLASRTPQDDDEVGNPSSHPTFVNREMLEDVRPFVEDIIEVIAERGDTSGMHYAPLETLAAAEMLGVTAHEQAAKALRGPLIHGLS